MNIKIGDVKIPVQEFAVQGNAILGIRDSGKSYTATYLAERLLDNGIPFVAFDPIGIWKFLRVPGKSSGYPVVVAGGKNGDLPLTPQSAPEIVRAAMRENIPLVLDLYDIELSKADWKRIVEQSVRLLLYENGEHGLRHIFIEEAAEFAPQRVQSGQGKVYAEIEKLARMGGNAQLGYTLINQRAEEVNKAVLELCDCLFLHRQKGRNSLTALGKWLDVGAVTDTKTIKESLPVLPQGECWVWLAGSDQPVRVKVPEKNTLHPDRRATTKTAKDQQNFDALDVTKFVTQMSTSLEKHLQQVKDNDPAKLKREIAALKRKLTKLETQAPATETVEVLKTVEVPILLNGHVESLMTVSRNLLTLSADLAASAEAVKATVEKALASKSVAIPASPRPRPKPIQTRPHPSQPIQASGDAPAYDSLSPGEQKILTACAQYYPEGLERTQISILVGYKRSTRDTYIQRLQSWGGLEQQGRLIAATEAGIQVLGDNFDPLPTGQALQDYWLGELTGGERALFELIVQQWPEAVERDFLTENSEYARSSRDTYLQRLKARMLITTPAPGLVKASDELFELA